MTKSKMANRYSPEVRATLENYVHRTEGLGAQVPITRICYYFLSWLPYWPFALRTSAADLEQNPIRLHRSLRR